MSDEETAKSENKLQIEEYKICKQQILDNIKSMDQLEIYSVGAIAAVFVFALSQTHAVVITFAIALSFLIASLGFVRFAALDKMIGILNDYVQTVEESTKEIGWTKYYRTKRTQYMKWSRYIVWAVLLGVTTSFLIIVLRYGPFWVVKTNG
jgi:hypothetical protein